MSEEYTDSSFTTKQATEKDPGNEEKLAEALGYSKIGVSLKEPKKGNEDSKGEDFKATSVDKAASETPTGSFRKAPVCDTAETDVIKDAVTKNGEAATVGRKDCKQIFDPVPSTSKVLGANEQILDTFREASVCDSTATDVIKEAVTKNGEAATVGRTDCKQIFNPVPSTSKVLGANEQILDTQCTSTGHRSAIESEVTNYPASKLAEETRKAAEEALEVASSSRKAIETLNKMITTVKKNISDYSEQLRAVGENENGEDNQRSTGLRGLVSKYETFENLLKRKLWKLSSAVENAETAAAEASEQAALADGLANENTEEAVQVKIFTRCSKDKAEIACVASLQREHAALVSMRNIWTDVTADGQREENPADSSNEVNQQQCQNRGSKTRYAAVIFLILGILCISIRNVFAYKRESYEAFLAFGIIMTSISTIYWIYKFVKCVKGRNCFVRRPRRVCFVENLERQIIRVEEHLQRHGEVPVSDAESDSGSLSTVVVEDVENN